MASFWSDWLVDFIQKTTGQSGTDMLAIATENVRDRSIENGYGYNMYWNRIDLAVGASAYLLIQTPADDLITMTQKFFISIDNNEAVTSDGNIKVFEGATVSDVGDDDDIQVTNYNRRTSETPDFIVKNAPTVTDEGTLLYWKTFTEELQQQPYYPTSFQLKASENYLIKVKNYSTVIFNFTLQCELFQLPL